MNTASNWPIGSSLAQLNQELASTPFSMTGTPVVIAAKMKVDATGLKQSNVTPENVLGSSATNPTVKPNPNASSSSNAWM